ncbi:UNVERIFIED_CONTAM: hypothetical protein PYX00_006400 [Menopon gallinae]|uniref:Fatty acyl-CoA reductase n=1 Tax=Menopon gallinae TaxID=328185 RepID=A0AAW2HV41_9NEOP
MEGDLTTKLHRKQSEKLFNGELKKTFYKQKAPERRFTWGAGLTKEIDNTGQFIKKTAEVPSCCLDPKEEQSEIQEFFRGCDVLITGATGFMGKILIEKLLVSCPNIGKIYLLIREKKGKSFDERFDILFREDVFVRLRELVPNFREKITAIKGDCSVPRLGLSDEDYDMLTKRVSVIFHGAATVRFDEPLKVAAHINVRGVWEMMKFAKQCSSLKSIMHVSTTYSNCTATNNEVVEGFYPPSYDYKRLLDLVDNEPEEDIVKMTPAFIKPWPNTYAFTKQIGEDIVRREGQGLPIGIFRPAIVVATYKEPIRGWSDNIYGPTGVIVGAGTGVLRVIQGDTNNDANLVPVDMVVNGLIAAAYRVSENFKQGKKSIDLFNYVSTVRNPQTWGEFSYWNGMYGKNWPTMLAIWYSSFRLVKYKPVYLLLHFLLHVVPAYLMDAGLVLVGKQPRMVKVYKKIRKFNVVLSFFSTKQFHFTDDNVHKLWGSLSRKDQEIFPFDIADLDWDYFAQGHLLGLRVYLVKDDIDTLHKARLRWKRLHLLHRGLQAFLVLLLSWLLLTLFRLTSN